eukprot:scpid85153/ scgid23220/ Transmembrane protein 93
MSGKVVFNEAALRGNAATVEFCRTAAASISGGAAGILGLTGLYGFIFYIIAALATSCLLVVRTRTNVDKYFLRKQNIWFDGILGAVSTYVLFWTFLYGMVHVH